MLRVVYAPEEINNYISTVYCSKYELTKEAKDAVNNYIPICYSTDDDHLSIIIDATRLSFYCLKFNDEQKQWTAYHADKANSASFSMENYLLEDCILDTSDTYLLVLQENEFKIIQHIGSGGFIEKGKYNEKIISPLLSTNPNDLSDIFILNRNGGIIHINSASGLDLIFSNMKISIDKQTTDLLMDIIFSESYLPHITKSVQNFTDIFGRVQNTKPLSGYDEIYQRSNKYDNEYFTQKMKIFQSEVVQMFNEFNCLVRSGLSLKDYLINFINGLKKDFAIELVNIYQRLRHFPTERIALFKKHKHHPYVKLLKIIHKKYSQFHKNNPGIPLNSSIIEYFFDDDQFPENKKADNYFVLYDNISSLILSALRQRSEIFGDVYALYHNTIKKQIKPKYKTNNNYFPFKIFSAHLFIMEHMLQYI